MCRIFLFLFLTLATNLISYISIGQCFDNWGCKMPECCGIIGGRLTNISITYVASNPMTNAMTHGYLVGLGLGSTENQINVPVPVTQVPNAVVAYDYNSCHYTSCPHEIGETYRFDGMFTVPTQAITTLTVIANFVADLLPRALQ